MKLNFKNIQELQKECEEFNNSLKYKIHITLRLPEKVYSEFTNLYNLEFESKYGKQNKNIKEPSSISYGYSNLLVKIISNERETN